MFAGLCHAPAKHAAGSGFGRWGCDCRHPDPFPAWQSPGPEPDRSAHHSHRLCTSPDKSLYSIALVAGPDLLLSRLTRSTRITGPLVRWKSAEQLADKGGYD